MPGLFSGLPKFHRGALALFAITAAATAIVADQPLGDALRLHPGALLDGSGVWQPLTANFVFPADGVSLLLGTLFTQWFIGSQLEAFWGTRKYLLLVLGSGTLGYLVHALVSPWLPPMVHGGSTAMDIATLTAFGIVFGKTQMSLMGAVNLRGRTLAMIFVGMLLIGPIARGAPWPIVIPWLVAIAAAYLATTQPWRKDGRSSGGGRTTTRSAPKRNKAKPSHLRVVKDDLPN